MSQEENVAPVVCPTDDNNCSEPQHAATMQTPHSKESVEETICPKILDKATIMSAYKTLRKYGKISNTVLTEEESKTLQWAKGIIEERHKLKKHTSNQSAKDAKPKPQKKRGRHPNYNSATYAELITKGKHSKKIKLSDGNGDSSAIDNPSQDLDTNQKYALAVLDRSIPDGSISTERWHMIKTKVEPLYRDILKENLPLLQYDDSGWYNNRIKLVKCVDELSSETYRQAIEKVGEVWPGAELYVIPGNKLCTNPKRYTLIPAKNSNPKDVLQLLLACNPHLPNDWYIAEILHSKFVQTRRMVLVLSKDMLQSLLKHKRIAFYGFGTIAINTELQRSGNKARVRRSQTKDVDERDDHFENEFNLEMVNSRNTFDDNVNIASISNNSEDEENKGDANQSTLEQLEIPVEKLESSSHQDQTSLGVQQQCSSNNEEVERTYVKELLANNLRTYVPYANDTTAILAVIDKNAGITKERWLIVQSRLVAFYWDILVENPGLLPQCDDSSWHGGYIKIIKCSNERSANLYRQAFGKIKKLWPEAKLELVKYDDLPKKPVAITYIYYKKNDPNKIMKYLISSNPNLPTHDWWIEDVGPKFKGKRRIMLHINEESLEILQKNGGNACFGLKEIIISPYLSDMPIECANDNGNDETLSRIIDGDSENQNHVECKHSVTVKDSNNSRADNEEDQNLKTSSEDMINIQSAVGETN